MTETREMTLETVAADLAARGFTVTPAEGHMGEDTLLVNGYHVRVIDATWTGTTPAIYASRTTKFWSHLGDLDSLIRWIN